jgi:uncharacterized membrane protein YqjE
MENLKEKFFKLLRLDNLIDNLSGYLESRLELYKLEIREDLAKVLSKAIIYALMAMCGVLFLIFLSIGLAHFLNVYFASQYEGYWIVAGIYALALLVFIVFRKTVNENFERHFIEMIKRKQK